MSKVNYWPTYALLGVLVVMGGLFLYSTNLHNERMEEIAIGQANKQIIGDNKGTEISPGGVEAAEDHWRIIYPNTKPLQIEEVSVLASVAKTWPERIQGLSDTPYLPENVVKLFVFDSVDFHSIWMKDMNYAIDIIWVDDDYKIVDIKKHATPESFPEAFEPKAPARYVIETVAGFVDNHNIKIGGIVSQSE